MADEDLGPLAARIPEALLGSAAYHVPQPPRVIAKLDANELPFGIPVELRSQLAAALAEVPLERYPDPRAARLRALIASQLGVSGTQLVFGNGSDELIAALCAAFAGPSRSSRSIDSRPRPEAGNLPTARVPLEGGPILYPVPSFVYYKLAAIARGLPQVEVPLAARFELDEPAMLRAIDAERPSVVFLALPNNPTGTLWRPDFALELAARHRDTVIVSDEAYVAYSGVTNLPHLAAHPNLVVMRTLSKIGMAGLRVGFTISSPALAGVLEKVRPPYNLSSLDQRAAEFLVEHASGWCAERAAEVVAERSRLAAALSARGLDVFASEANLLLVKFPDAQATWQRLAAAGIVVRSFGSVGPLASCLRITVGTPAENAALLSELGTLSTSSTLVT